MKWIIFSITLVIAGCSPSRRIQYHINKLEKLEEKHPELFEPIEIDTVILQKELKVTSDIIKKIDTVLLKKLAKDTLYYKLLSDSLELELHRKGIKDCDTVIKYIRLEGKTKIQIKEVYKQGECEISPIFYDTLGVHIFASTDNNRLNIEVKVDSIHIKKACPPCPIFEQKEYYEFWQFWCALLIPPFLVTLLIRWVLRLNVR